MEEKEFTPIQLTDDEWSLFKYIPNVERLKGYVGRMENCANIDQVMDRVILPMLLNEPEVTAENSEKKDFYTRLQPFIKHLRGSSGTTLFERISSLNETLRRENRRGQTLAGILRQIKIEAPNPGEEAVCIIELIINTSPEHDNLIRIGADLVGVEYRKTTSKHFDGESGVNFSATAYLVRGNIGSMLVLLRQIKAYSDDNNIAIRYRSSNIDREGLTLSQAIEFAEKNI